MRDLQIYSLKDAESSTRSDYGQQNCLLLHNKLQPTKPNGTFTLGKFQTKWWKIIKNYGILDDYYRNEIKEVQSEAVEEPAFTF